MSVSSKNDTIKVPSGRVGPINLYSACGAGNSIKIFNLVRGNLVANWRNCYLRCSASYYPKIIYALGDHTKLSLRVIGADVISKLIGPARYISQSYPARPFDKLFNICTCIVGPWRRVSGPGALNWVIPQALSLAAPILGGVRIPKRFSRFGRNRIRPAVRNDVADRATRLKRPSFENISLLNRAGEVLFSKPNRIIYLN